MRNEQERAGAGDKDRDTRKPNKPDTQTFFFHIIKRFDDIQFCCIVGKIIPIILKRKEKEVREWVRWERSKRRRRRRKSRNLGDIESKINVETS
jgi:hypothetical protein